MGKKILVIEDESHIAEGIRLNLQLSGHDVVWAKNGEEGLQQWQKQTPDLVVLDIMMPKLDGLEVLKRIRTQDAKIPILILSAKNESESKVSAFGQGVDDYLSKPFSLEEFLVRVERLLLRSSWNGDTSLENDVYTFGKNTLYPHLFKAFTPRGEIPLTEQEVKVLTYFISRPKIPLKRSELLEVGWGYHEEVQSRTLDNFIVRFRRYFEENPKKPVYFQSVRGIGYIFDPQS